MPKYQYMSCEMDEVETNPQEYIIPECLEACKILWSKNIFTFMCSNNEDFGYTWIATYDLSNENQEVLEKLKAMGYVDEYRGAPKLFVNEMGINAQNKLVELSNKFVMQDIPYGYQSVESFLMNTCNCYKDIPNPEYEYMEPADENDWEKYIAYLDYGDSIKSQKTIKAFDKNKMIKTIDEYINEAGLSNLYIENESKIYLNSYYLNKHNNYLKYIYNNNSLESNNLKV